MEKYIISESTLVLFSLGDKTRVIEKYQEFIVDEKATDIVNNSCMFYGSSLVGRTKSCQYLLGIKYKCPIVISEIKKIFFFPTTSVKNRDCSWINYHAIKEYYKSINNVLNIILINNKLITLDVSNNVFCNQVLKTSRLESILRKIS